ncbi:MAG: DUF4105 domain-containing protein, partial [Gemmatimonadales bacterium]
MTRRLLLACSLLIGPVAAPAQAPAGDHLQVYLMTMGAGAEIYERFGHNALWIHDTVAHTDRIYNYGVFEFPKGVSELLAFYGR